MLVVRVGVDTRITFDSLQSSKPRMLIDGGARLALNSQIISLNLIFKFL